MHNAAEGFAATDDLPQYQAGPSLLRSGDPSSVCLNCHEQSGTAGPSGFLVSTAEGDMPPGVPPRQLGPAGDFGWLKKSYTWNAGPGNRVESSSGESPGHNLLAADYGYFPDPLNAAAPGGNYPAQQFACISCHDPHGSYRRDATGTIRRTGLPIRGSGSSATSAEPDSAAAVGVYRLLGGVGYAPQSVGAAPAFTAPPPAAVAPADSNRSESATQTRVAYGRGMSAWCRNCHADIHSQGVSEPGDPMSPGGLKHVAGDPDGLLDAALADNYNRYLRTGDLSGSAATAYLSLVPFEVGTDNYATLRQIVTLTPAEGPNTATGRPAVMCLTCHRAHASGWDQATRWNERSAYVVYDGSYAQEGQLYQPYGQGRSAAEALQAYYGIPASTFASAQSSLCNKCHVRD
jgi:hypothetical protein